MKKFEYKIISNYPNVSSLNNMGRRGWELIIVVDNLYIFKREIEEDEDE